MHRLAKSICWICVCRLRQASSRECYPSLQIMRSCSLNFRVRFLGQFQFTGLFGITSAQDGHSYGVIWVSFNGTMSCAETPTKLPSISWTSFSQLPSSTSPAPSDRFQECTPMDERSVSGCRCFQNCSRGPGPLQHREYQMQRRHP